MNERTDEWVQPIAIVRSGTHEEVVASVATASVLAYANTPDLDTWAAWLSGPYTKSVRRGTSGQIARAALLPEAASCVRVGDAEAHGFAPCPRGALPDPLSKMQVSGTEREHSGAWDNTWETQPAHAPVMIINADLGMSTGKSAAQAAHGSFLWWLNNPALRDAWHRDGCRVSVFATGEADFGRYCANAFAVVMDAGFTEIPARSITVAVLTPEEALGVRA